MYPKPHRPCYTHTLPRAQAERTSQKDIAKDKARETKAAAKANAKSETAKAKAKAKSQKATAKAKAKSQKATAVHTPARVVKGPGKSKTVAVADLPRKLPHSQFGSLQAIYATAKSYILYPGDDLKLHLFCEVHGSKTSQHADICSQIMRRSSNMGLSKVDAVALRAKLLQ